MPFDHFNSWDLVCKQFYKAVIFTTLEGANLTQLQTVPNFTQRTENKEPEHSQPGRRELTAAASVPSLFSRELLITAFLLFLYSFSKKAE